MADKKYVKIKNTSRGRLFLDLGMENNNKVIQLKADQTTAITSTAWDYLVNSCPNLFKNGMIKLVESPKDVEIEEVDTENVYSETDIAKIVEMKLAAFKKKINEIDSLVVIKDIRLKAAEEGANDPIPNVSRKLATKPMIAVTTACFIPNAHNSWPVMPVIGSFSVLAFNSFVLRTKRIAVRTIPARESPFNTYIIKTYLQNIKFSWHFIPLDKITISIPRKCI